MPKTNEKVIAILCADLHLSSKPPIWRSAEEDWYKAMQRPLDEIVDLQTDYDCPILCAGDIFDKWNSSAELINFALGYLPDRMYCIPGQHDLPDHNYSEIHRSAYETLVRAGKIRNILINNPRGLDDIWIWGFPFGNKLSPHLNKDSRCKIALVHEYKWIPGYSYPNPPKENKLSTALAANGYDVIVYGDNHNGFLYANMAGTAIFNCGTLMRRKSDEIDYKPQVGLLLESGRVEPHFLDISQDKYIDGVDNSAPVEEMDMSEFIAELKKLGETGLEFVERVERFFKKNKTRKAVQKIIRKGMEE